MKKRNFLAAVTLMVISLAACTKTDVDKGARVVYEEDFNGSSAWYKGTTAYGYTASESGGNYIMYLNGKGLNYSNSPKQVFTGKEKKQVLEFTLRIKSGEGAVGLLFNKSDDSNYGHVYLSANGNFIVRKYSAGKLYDITEWTSNASIALQNSSKATIELENGNVTILINGNKLYTWANSGITTLDTFGLGASIWESYNPIIIEVDKVRALAVD